eukprot:TRINITY_DN5411_c0_g1_i2.p1 TRINITY_DN5411_c0_g1~~TRINITY_DN5411_c0_g1_i2.p1  ORF type:complete len:1709 (-),score=401.63 TRINITY_DN5411_c0_g1_i2:62-4453(-)
MARMDEDEAEEDKKLQELEVQEEILKQAQQLRGEQQEEEKRKDEELVKKREEAAEKATVGAETEEQQTSKEAAEADPETGFHQERVTAPSILFPIVIPDDQRQPLCFNDHFDPPKFFDTLEHIPMPVVSGYSTVDVPPPPAREYTMMAISGMTEFSNLSFEELRYLQYSRSAKKTFVSGKAVSLSVSQVKEECSETIKNCAADSKMIAAEQFASEVAADHGNDEQEGEAAPIANGVDEGGEEQVRYKDDEGANRKSHKRCAPQPPRNYLKRRTLENVIYSGQLWSWGTNTHGELGLTDRQRHSGPTYIRKLRGESIISTACGSLHTLALTADGQVLSWGYGLTGCLGHGTAKQYPRPKIIEYFTGKTIIMIACGYSHSVVLSEDGSVYTWGDGTLGRLGNGRPFDTRNPHPVALLSNKNVAFIAAGGSGSCAICCSGDVYMWGNNSVGQLGLGRRLVHKVLPLPVLMSSSRKIPFKYISLGGTHSAGITIDGDLFSWGGNSYGQLGIGNMRNQCEPVRVTDYISTSEAGCYNLKRSHADVVHVSCGVTHTAAVTADGRLFTWGQHTLYRLGYASDQSVRVPHQVACNRDKFRQVSCGNSHTAGLTVDGCCWLWGADKNGVLCDADRTCVPKGSSLFFTRIAEVADLELPFRKPMLIKYISGIKLLSSGSTFNVGLIDFKNTAVQHAKDGNVRELFKVLDTIDFAAYKKRSHPQDLTPLHWACILAKDNVVDFFIEHFKCNPTKFSINCITRSEATPMHVCAERGTVSCMELLIKAGAELNSKNAKGNTPLHMAVLFDKIPCVQALVFAAADKTKRNKEGMTPLHIAVDVNYETAAFLLQHASPFDILDNQNRQPLDICVDKTKREHLRNLAQKREVFISYAHSDIKFASKLKEELERHCLRCWIDSTRLAAGSDWRSDIGNGVLNSKVLVYVISNTSSQSDWCIKELHLARKQGLMICPIWYERADLMAEVQALIYGVGIFQFDQPMYFNSSLGQLVDQLRTLLAAAYTDTPPTMPVPKDIGLEELETCSEPFLFIAHVHDQYAADDTAHGIALKHNLLQNNVHSCLDSSNKARFDGAYIASMWRDHAASLLQKCSGFVALLSVRTLWDKQAVLQIRRAVELKKRIYVVFIGANVFRLTEEEINEYAPKITVKKIRLQEDMQQPVGLFTWDTPRVWWRKKPPYRKLTPFSHFVTVAEERALLLQCQEQEKQAQKEELQLQEKKNLSNRRKKNKQRRLRMGGHDDAFSCNTVLVPEIYFFKATTAAQLEEQQSRIMYSPPPMVEPAKQDASAQKKQKKPQPPDLLHQQTPLNLDDVVALHETRVTQAREAAERDRERRAQEQGHEADDTVALAGLTARQRAKLASKRRRAAKEAEDAAAAAAAAQLDGPSVARELQQCLGECPVFYLGRDECQRQLVYTVQMWERDGMISRQIERLSQDLSGEEAKLHSAEETLQEYTSVYSFH